MNENDVSRKGKGGRPRKNDPAGNCLMMRFNDVEYARFLSMYDQSGIRSKARFILARVFGEPFRVVKTDAATVEFVSKLTAFNSQIRSIGVNYNQVVKELHTHFTEQKARALLYKLEQATIELATIGRDALQLCEEFKAKVLQNGGEN